MFLILLGFVILVIPFSQAANILAILPTPSYSHQIVYSHLWKHLSLRGHKVTLITTDPMKDATLRNLTEIDVKFSYKYFQDIGKMAENEITMWNIYDWNLSKGQIIAEAQLTYPPVQNLIHNKTNFDVVFVEFFYPEFLAFAELYKCPKILFSSLDVSIYFHRQMGNAWHPVLHSDLGAPYVGSLNFGEKVISTIYSWYVSYVYDYKMIPKKQILLQKYFNIKLTLEEIINDVDMLFLNVNPMMQGVRAMGPATVNIGGRRANTIFTKPLPQDLKEFLDGAKNGFIYFSLGSNVKSKDLNKDSLSSIIETLREMPCKVLWKFEADELPGKPDNVKLVKWAPQEAVLSHPNIKLFVTQGGLQSTEEAIYSAVPLVVIPFFADQEKNANLMTSKGIAKRVDRKPFIQKTDLKDAILEVLNNPSYKDSVKRLKDLALDTPMTGLETAIWWTEYVIRNKGAKHLRNPAADIPFYQYYLIDVISFLVILTILVLSLLIVLVRTVFKIIFRVFNHKNIVADKKLR